MVLSGRTGNFLYSLYGLNLSATGDRFGTTVAAGFDVDGDQVPDFAASSCYYHMINYVLVFSGATGQVLYTLRSAQAQARFGWGLALGHFDGDQYGDLAVTAHESVSPQPRLATFAPVPLPTMTLAARHRSARESTCR